MVSVLPTTSSRKMGRYFSTLVRVDSLYRGEFWRDQAKGSYHGRSNVVPLGVARLLAAVDDSANAIALNVNVSDDEVSRRYTFLRTRRDEPRDTNPNLEWRRYLMDMGTNSNQHICPTLPTTILALDLSVLIHICRKPQIVSV